MKDLFSIDGKVALVTGGSRGIGLMIARGYVEAGARVYVSSRKADACDAAAAELSRAGHCVSLPADVSRATRIFRFTARPSCVIPPGPGGSACRSPVSAIQPSKACATRWRDRRGGNPCHRPAARTAQTPPGEGGGAPTISALLRRRRPAGSRLPQRESSRARAIEQPDGRLSHGWRRCSMAHALLVSMVEERRAGQ